MLHALIMAGGGGTRFWPRSRQKRPKQFLSFSGDRTLLQLAGDRLATVIEPRNTWVLTGHSYVDETQRQLPDVPTNQVIGEPVGRDTAACIALGSALIAMKDPEAVIVVMPADHLIEPVQEFSRVVRGAAHLAEENPTALITAGISPTYPATGYGYIQRGEPIASRQGVNAFRVQAFREKPQPDIAERFVASGDYFWNSGIFVWKVSAILGAIAQRQPRIHAAVECIARAWHTPDRQEVFRREYEKLERISIDYAVMEGARNALVVQAPWRWDDVGSWLALERANPQDSEGNTVLGEHCGLNTRNCVIVSDAGRLVATIGVENLLIVQDGDATLVADRRVEGAVKQLVDLLNKKGLERYL